VIWNINPKQKSPTTLHLGKHAAKLHIVNMVGTPIAVDAKNIISVSSYPIYLRGACDVSTGLLDSIKLGFDFQDSRLKESQ
jgi:hypothetical protein